MTVSLGGIALSEHLALSGLESAAVTVNQRRTLTGVSVLQSASSPGGRTLILTGDIHFTFAQVTALRDLSAMAQPVVLIHHRGTFTVLITAIEAETIIDYADPHPEDWYSCTITLIEA
ncbi:MAG: hypothetical protein JZU65_12810 [Chlorobium sp.]|jgi:hypothetical protein|nr:hypothetical protein [Chlorobium sp.]